MVSSTSKGSHCTGFDKNIVLFLCGKYKILNLPSTCLESKELDVRFGFFLIFQNTVLALGITTMAARDLNPRIVTSFKQEGCGAARDILATVQSSKQQLF